ncbi:hypothetical protein BDV18DRAFT_163612 [Aspergillus unguis]
MFTTTPLQLLSLSILLLSPTASAKKTSTTVGLETAEGSRGITVPFNDCYQIEEEEIFTLALSQPCRVFTGPLCTDRNTVLKAGEHKMDDPTEPVPIVSLWCEEEKKSVFSEL